MEDSALHQVIAIFCRRNRGLRSTGEFFDAEADRQEERDLSASKDTTALAAKARLQQVLKSLPKDADPPFLLLSQSAFKLRTAEREEKKR